MTYILVTYNSSPKRQVLLPIEDIGKLNEMVRELLLATGWEFEETSLMYLKTFSDYVSGGNT